MNELPRKLNLRDWDARYEQLLRAGLKEPSYGGPLRRHVKTENDLRLEKLEFDNSPAALRLWNFLLTENRRLKEAHNRGEKLVGTMKDLGTVPVMAYSLPQVRAFYPDGTWWTPCLMECSDRLLEQADALGIDASFCPVRAMVPAFINHEHFPAPDLLICSTGAVCDDFSAIAQRLERLGFRVRWWEMPRRRAPDPGEPACELPGGLVAPAIQVACVREELERVRALLADLRCAELTDDQLAAGIRRANAVRRVIKGLRDLVYSGRGSPLPGLEMLVAEMLAIHFCSDRDEAMAVLNELLSEATTRAARGQSIVSTDAIRMYWVNPVADLRAMNLLEDCGGRLCGSDFMFAHALDLIPEDLPPMEALARTALADPMVGSTAERADRIVAECRAAGAQALVVARIPGASHCAREGTIIRERVRTALSIPSIEIEIPPVCDPLVPHISTRLQALIEAARSPAARPVRTRSPDDAA